MHFGRREVGAVLTFDFALIRETLFLFFFRGPVGEQCPRMSGIYRRRAGDAAEAGKPAV